MNLMTATLNLTNITENGTLHTTLAVISEDTFVIILFCAMSILSCILHGFVVIALVSIKKLRSRPEYVFCMAIFIAEIMRAANPVLNLLLAAVYPERDKVRKMALHCWIDPRHIIGEPGFIWHDMLLLMQSCDRLTCVLNFSFYFRHCCNNYHYKMLVAIAAFCYPFISYCVNALMSVIQFDASHDVVAVCSMSNMYCDLGFITSTERRLPVQVSQAYLSIWLRFLICIN